MDNKPTALSRTKSEGSNGASDPAKLRAEIAETRNQMSGTIEQLHGRLNPVVYKEQALEQFHEATETIKQELKERLHEAKETLIAEFKDVKETVRVDVLDEIDTVKSRVNDEIVQAKAAVREATIGKVENMSRSVKDVVASNPIPATLAGVGLAWLFFEGRRRRTGRRHEFAVPERRLTSGRGFEAEQGYEEDTSIRDRIRDVGEETKERVAGAASTVGDVARDAKDSVSEMAQRGRERASELTRETKDKAKELTRETKDKARELTHEAREQVRRIQRRSNELYRANPIAIGAAMLAAGTIVGLAVPRTSVETEWMGSARDNVVGKAQELAHQAFGKAGEAVKRVGESDESRDESSIEDDVEHEFH